jgi:hypothetical protein
MPATLMTSSWLFPPRTREVQFDEMWAFVGKKQKNCDPANPDDDHKGDWWDHVAFDPLCGAPHRILSESATSGASPSRSAVAALSDKIG